MARRSKVVGFALEHGAKYPFGEVLKSILKMDGESCGKTRQRSFSVAEKDKWVVGRIVADTSNEDRLLRRTDSDRIHIRNDPVGDNEQQVGVNYFIFHTISKSGLYTSYGGSLAYSDFTDLLFHGIPSKIIRDRRKAESKAIKAGNPNIEDVEVKRQVDVSFAAIVSPLLRREELEKVLASWQQIGGIRYSIATAGAVVGDLEPLKPYARLEMRELKLTVETDRKSFLKHLGEAVKGLMKRYDSNLKRTVVIGKNERKDPETLDITKIVESFGKLEVAMLKSHHELTRTDFRDGAIISELCKIAGEFPDYFAKVKRVDRQRTH